MVVHATENHNQQELPTVKVASPHQQSSACLYRQLSDRSALHHPLARVTRLALAFLVYAFKQMAHCRHHNAVFSEGKVVCPDCGQALIRNWVMLRCADCDGLRRPVYWFDSVLPGERHCPHCGGQAFYQVPIELPLQPQHLPWAILTRQSHKQRQEPKWKVVRVWVEAQRQTGLLPLRLGTNKRV